MRACSALLFFLFCLCEAADINFKLSIDYHEKQGTANKNTECKNAGKEVVVPPPTVGTPTVPRTVELSPTTVPPSVRCSDGSDGFTLDGSVCYYMSTEGKTWNESRQFCRSKQSHLMIIKSEEKEDLLLRILRKNNYVWIGLSHNDVQGIWKWVDGTLLTTPTYWAPGQPDHNTEDCAIFIQHPSHASHSGWYDRTCSDTYAFVCEKLCSEIITVTTCVV